jgi:hypothetical protein
MLVFKDRSTHHIFALERISKFTICSPSRPRKIDRQKRVEERPFMAVKRTSQESFHAPQARAQPEEDAR